MIKADKGQVQFKGSGIELLADFGVITLSVYEYVQKMLGEKAEEAIRESFETGLKMAKEKPKETPDVLDDIENLLKLIKEIKEK